MAKRNNTYSCWSILRNQIKLFQLELGPTVILQSLGVKPTRHLPVCRSQANPSPSCLWESGRPVTFQSVGVKLIGHLLTCESQCNPSPSKLWESCRSILNTSPKQYPLKFMKNIIFLWKSHFSIIKYITYANKIKSYQENRVIFNPPCS